jgi:hypothetical protein
MMHRLECDASETCGCECRCHVRCRYPMPLAKMPCWRLAGHGGEHRSRAALAAAVVRHRRRVTCDHPLAARATDGRRTWCWACRVAA